MIVDPWASPARPAAAGAWGNPTDTVTAAGQPDIWSARRSPSPGRILVKSSVLVNSH